MKYIKEYNEHKNYEQFYLFRFDNSPSFSSFQKFTQIDISKLEKIIKNMFWKYEDKNKLYLDYRSKIEINPFYMLDWPLMLKDDAYDIEDDDTMDRYMDWKNGWLYILNNKTFSESPETKDKCLHFECKVNGFTSYYRGSYHRVSIIKDDDGYYYVTIDYQGYKKHFKCDQEYGLEDCLRTELKNWNM